MQIHWKNNIDIYYFTKASVGLYIFARDLSPFNKSYTLAYTFLFLSKESNIQDR